MDVTISIIIPVYNVEKYLTECLDSVLGQTVPFDEIIIINDGSTDKSSEICRAYKANHSGIKLIEQKNAGLSAARNVGMDIAKGDYIVFLDSDDYVSPKMCETIKHTLDKKGLLDVVYYAADFVKEVPIAFPEEGYARSSEAAGLIWNGFQSLKKLFPEYFQMSACMSAYRRTFLEGAKINFIKGILYEDRFFSLRVITEAETVVYIVDKLYTRRFRADSIITSPASKRKITDVLYGHKMEWDYIKGNENWNSNRGLTQYFVLWSSYMAFQRDVSSSEEELEQKAYIVALLNYWFTYFDIDIMSINELTFLLYILKKIKKNINLLCQISHIMPEANFFQYSEKVKHMLRNKCKEKLSALPFQKRACIGIYGIGSHTEYMLDLYKEMVGNIKADIYFIVTQSLGKSEFMGKEIKETDSIYPDTESIIVSSKLYQAEICKRLDSSGFTAKRIMTLYNQNDAVDFVIIGEVLQGDEELTV